MESWSSFAAMTATLTERCKDKGLRLTGQRRAIAEVIDAAQDHPDVEELHRRVQAVDPRVSLATVYRTVKLFDGLGLLERLDFGGGRARYEASDREHHDHLIDISTGKVIEFVDPEIEALQERIAARLGYKLHGHRMELFGTPVNRRDKRNQD